MGKFLQSRFDFPLIVSIGEKVPSFGMRRWHGNSGLRFVPLDDEGFTLRGDKRRLLYKGRRRSHRFTILGDSAFEYDCILLREPESNVIVLRMDGADRFDFYRQPDFVKDDFLKGSYAVYLKETMIGQGTGKLCHIHRPEIIDARGRRCWGELAIVNDKLRITISEAWLSEAKYPVVVDPVIGTTTVGSQVTGPDPDFDYYDSPTLENQIAVCKYTTSLSITGQCTAYVYVCYRYYSEDLKPVLFTQLNKRPCWRISKNQQTIPAYIQSPAQNGWKSGTFTIDVSVAASSVIWFGFFSGNFSTRFDYGGDCYKFWRDDELLLSDDLPQSVPSTEVLSYMNIIFSWFFINGNSKFYEKKLTNGINLFDTHVLTREFVRKITQEAAAFISLEKFSTFLRAIKENVQTGSKAMRRAFYFIRLVTKLYVRDYFLRRFLKARSEVQIKSCITREITLESRFA